VSAWGSTDGVRCLVACAALCAALWLAGCGAGTSGAVVARVGTTAITSATLAHWVTVLAGGRASVSPARRVLLRRQALELLISARWLLGEADAHRLRPSEQAVALRMRERRKAEFPGGEAEARAFAREAGITAKDLELEARAELASAGLRRLAGAEAGRVSRAQIVAYYAQNPGRFTTPEQRYVSIANRKTKAACERLRREIEARGSVVSSAQRRVGEGRLHMSAGPGHRAVVESALYAYRPYVLTGPVKIARDYFVFKIERVVPARRRPLAEVEGAIRAQLSGEARQRALATFAAAWRAKWSAQTDCRRGYVVPKCRQYVGPPVAEAPLALP